MVPILIVLCPSFVGETGAYQAAAIALASDILGSAVTAAIYIKNGKSDLKRGWIMLACILSMCMVGNYAAWLAGNVVLGGFTLFLTIFIGIRFLVKPDTERRDTLGKEGRLDVKGMIISLFFGLTIGFGTGFVGTGGGMMMLIVFTAFLGMELKTAVGTSTFIMTFTALIASVSHIFINPAIVFEKWDLLLCIVTATAASLVSAKFANKVNSRTVGLVTGAVLTVLGAAMFLLNCREQIMQVLLLADVLYCFGAFCGFIVCGALLLIVLHFLIKIPDFVFRKLLHIVAFGSVVVMLLVGKDWSAATISAVLFAVIVYPILILLEKQSWYSGFFVQKNTGEIKRSLLLLFGMAAILIAVCWGIMGRRDIAVAAVLMWGCGDATAAIFGKRLGRHHVSLPHIDNRKTYEGTCAMIIISYAIGVGSLCLQGAELVPSLLMTLPAAAIGAAVELISPSEWDTVTVPASITAVLTLLIILC